MPPKKTARSASGSRKSVMSESNSSGAYSFAQLKENINKNFSLYVVGVLLLVAGFAGGSLWQENQMLKNGTGSAQVAAVPTAPDAVAPQGPTADQLNNMPELTKEDHRRGGSNAKVTLVEYSDYECPFCKRFHETMMTIVEEYGNDVAWVYRHYPLSFHASAQKAAEAAECVAKLGGEDAFWAFSDLYYERTDSSGTGVLEADMPALAAEVGVNQAAVKDCLDSGEMAGRVQSDFDGGNTAGVSGTPGTLVVTKDGVQELIPGALPVESVREIVDRYL